MPAKPLPELTDVEKTAFFWAPLDKSDDCWVWLGPRDRRRDSGKDYGVFAVYRNGLRIAVKAHRLMLFLCYGIEAEMACHHCDNPPCVRPSHLYAGDAKTNARDARDRDRIGGGARLGGKRPDATRMLAGRTHAAGHLTSIERTDEIKWDMLDDQLDADLELGAYLDRLTHGGRLPEVVA